MRNLPEPRDLAYQVFATDRRVTDWARDGNDNADHQHLVQIVLRTWMDQGEGYPSPVRDAYIDAMILGERVGTRWEDTAHPTLVRALADSEDLWPLGFPRTMIRPGETEKFHMNPYIEIRGRRLVLGHEHECDNLLVHSIQAANINLVVSSRPVYGGCFSSTAFPFRLDFPTTGPANTIRLEIENIGPDDITIAPTLFGVCRKERTESWRGY